MSGRRTHLAFAFIAFFNNREAKVSSWVLDWNYFRFQNLPLSRSVGPSYCLQLAACWPFVNTPQTQKIKSIDFSGIGHKVWKKFISKHNISIFRHVTWNSWLLSHPQQRYHWKASGSWWLDDPPESCWSFFFNIHQFESVGLFKSERSGSRFF